MTVDDTPRADSDPMLPEVTRFWPALLDGAAFITDETIGGNLFDKLPSKMKQGDWQAFAIAAAFLVSDMADRLGTSAQELHDMAEQLRARAADEVTA